MPRQEVRNAAIVLLSLPDEEAAALMRAFEPTQLETIAREIADIDSIVPDEQQSAVRLFAGEEPVHCVAPTGGIQRAERLVRLALRDNGNELIARLRERAIAAPLASLEPLSNATLAELLVEEHPQTIAAVLAHLPTRRVAEILERLRPELRLGTIRRIAKIGPIDARAIRDVVDTLVDRAARGRHRADSGFSLPLAS